MALKGLQGNNTLAAAAEASAAARELGGHFSNPGYSGVFTDGSRQLNEITDGALIQPKYITPEQYGAAQAFCKQNGDASKRTIKFYNMAKGVAKNDSKVMENFNGHRSALSDNLTAQTVSTLGYLQNLEANRGIEGYHLHQYGETNRETDALLSQLEAAIDSTSVRV